MLRSMGSKSAAAVFVVVAARAGTTSVWTALGTSSELAGSRWACIGLHQPYQGAVLLRFNIQVGDKQLSLEEYA